MITFDNDLVFPAVVGQSKELVVKEKPAPEDKEPQEADGNQADDKETGSDKLEAQEQPSQPELMTLAVAPKVCR